MKKLIVLSVAVLLTLSLQAAITNTYEVVIDSATLSVQPTPTDLAQAPSTVRTIISGGMHGVTPGEEGFSLFFDSIAEGNFGTNQVGPYNLDTGLFSDGVSNGTTFICIFDAPKKIQEVHIFGYWGDDRQFNYTEIWGSTTGTNDADYTKLGTMVNGEWHETNDPPNQSYYRTSRLYDPDDGTLANNIRSLKFVQKNCGYGIEAGKGVMLEPNTPQGSYVGCSGSAIREIDIIGIPEPTLLFSGLLLGLAFLRRK